MQVARKKSYWNKLVSMGNNEILFGQRIVSSFNIREKNIRMADFLESLERSTGGPEKKKKIRETKKPMNNWLFEEYSVLV